MYKKVSQVKRIEKLKELSLEKDIVEVVRTSRLSYFGHVARMYHYRYPHKLLHGHTEENRIRGTPRKRWLNNVAEDCEMLHLSVRLAHSTDNNGDQLSGILKLELPERADSLTSPWH